MDQLEFAQPAWLAAGLVAGGGLIYAYRHFDRRNRADLESFVSGGLLQQFFAGISRPRRLLKRGCFVAAIVLLFAALARPQLGHEWREVKRKGIDILFALDASRSMLAEDIAPNRLGRAKLGMVDFIDKLEGDRIGLMPFAGSAFMLCPLTLDYNAFRESLDAIDTEIIPHKGTDLASAIREAGRAFDEAGNNHRILVVITDGEDLQGEALEAATRAAADGMIIHTVGIGSSTGELIPIGNDFVRDQQGELVRSKLDEASLRAIAEASGGIYAPFGQNAEGLRQIYAEKLSLVPKGELAQRMQQIPIERFHWPLAAAIGLFFLEFLIGDRRQSRASGPSARLAAPTLIALAFLSITGFADASDARQLYNEGVASYQSGDFDAASQSFQSTIENSDDLGLQNRAYYNLGNTNFKSGAAKLGQQADPKTVITEWERSLEAFDGALALQADDEDAQFNRDLVQRKIDELKAQQQQNQQDQDQQDQQDQDQDKQSQAEQKQDHDQQSEDQDQNPQDGESKAGEQKPEQDPSAENAADQGSEDEKSAEDKASDPATSENQEEQAGEASQPEPQEPAEKPEDQQAGAGESGGEAASGEEPKQVDQTAAPAAERRNPGEMSKEEARQLLQSLEDDEDRVLLVPAQRGNPRSPNNTTKGKDW